MGPSWFYSSTCSRRKPSRIIKPRLFRKRTLRIIGTVFTGQISYRYPASSVKALKKSQCWPNQGELLTGFMLSLTKTRKQSCSILPFFSETSAVADVTEIVLCSVKCSVSLAIQFFLRFIIVECYSRISVVFAIVSRKTVFRTHV